MEFPRAKLVTHNLRMGVFDDWKAEGRAPDNDREKGEPWTIDANEQPWEGEAEFLSKLEAIEEYARQFGTKSRRLKVYNDEFLDESYHVAWSINYRARLTAVHGKPSRELYEYVMMRAVRHPSTYRFIDSSVKRLVRDINEVVNTKQIKIRKLEKQLAKLKVEVDDSQQQLQVLNSVDSSVTRVTFEPSARVVDLQGTHAEKQLRYELEVGAEQPTMCVIVGGEKRATVPLDW